MIRNISDPLNIKLLPFCLPPLFATVDFRSKRAPAVILILQRDEQTPLYSPQGLQINIQCIFLPGSRSNKMYSDYPTLKRIPKGFSMFVIWIARLSDDAVRR